MNMSKKLSAFAVRKKKSKQKKTSISSLSFTKLDHKIIENGVGDYGDDFVGESNGKSKLDIINYETKNTVKTDNIPKYCIKRKIENGEKKKGILKKHKDKKKEKKSKRNKTRRVSFHGLCDDESTNMSLFISGGNEDEERNELSTPSVPLITTFDQISSSSKTSVKNDSNMKARTTFEWLINPINCEQFFAEHWEKKPLLIRRKDNDYYDGVFSCQEFDKILRENHLQFTKNIDITSYSKDTRKTLNPDGRAYPAIVWDHYNNGCSIRLLNPQTFSSSVWKLNSSLQEFFGSFAGANMYLTPPGSQGFAPHYDDIEAFVIQLEGKKLWKVYPPFVNEKLPRFSSHNFKRSDITTEPLMQVELEPGDLLYFPRGFIHEAKTIENEHSLHITISTYQKNTWGDLIEKLVPNALQMALEEDVQFREGLPLDYLHYMGIANQDMQNKRRDAFLLKVKDLMSKLINYAAIDSAVDQMGKGFIHDSLPPCLTQREKLSSIHTNNAMWNNGKLEEVVDLEQDSLIRLIRYKAVRLVMEEETVRLYHTLENSREFHEYDAQYVDIGAELAPAVEYLIENYPNYVPIDSLPLEELDKKMEIANLLFDKGLITIMQTHEFC